MRLDSEGRWPRWAGWTTAFLMSAFLWALLYAVARFLYSFLFPY